MTGRTHVGPVPGALTLTTLTTVNGRAHVVAVSVLLGIAVVWSLGSVDRTIGDNVANPLLGYDARGAAISGTLAGGVFASVTRLAGTFTLVYRLQRVPAIFGYGWFPRLPWNSPARRPRLS